MRTLTLTALFLTAAQARAAAPVAAPETSGPIDVPLARARDVPPAVPPKLGVSADLGVPEGLAVSFVYRPWRPLRLHAGPAWNYVSWGLQGGVDLVPVTWAVSPVLSLEGGHHLDADLSRFARSSTGLSAVLRGVSYDYAAVLLGVELGAGRGLVLSLRAGLGYVWLDAKGRADSASSSSAGTTYHIVDPTLRGTIPCVKLGLQYGF